MQNQQTKLTDFQILGKLGQGAFGQVFKVKRKKDGSIYALKKVRIAAMKQKDRNNALNQIRILASDTGQYIIGYKDSFFDEISNTLCIVMQLAAGGDLLKCNKIHIKNSTLYEESQIWKGLVHMTKGLKSLHDKKILHRDLKSANIFKTQEGIYKLGDLNVSKVLKKDFAQTQIGTPYYASPQIWKDLPYDVKNDMWSLGCVIYEMAALKPPFSGTDLQSLSKNICKGQFKRIPNEFSQQLCYMINRLLSLDPKNRFTTEQVLSHDYVKQRFEGVVEQLKSEDGPKLLKTLKLNHKNLRSIKNILPKSNYNSNCVANDNQSKKQINVLKKPIPSILNNQKLQQYLNQQNLQKKNNRINKIVQPKQQLAQQIEKRQRVLSACGSRRPYNCLTPEHKKKQPIPNIKLPPASTKNPRKQYNPKLPPKPLGPSYQKPPQPRKNRQSSERKIPSVEKSGADKSREQSKQTFRRLGQKIIEKDQSQKISPKVRCFSAQKIVYPSWWNE